MCCSPWGRKESDTTERLNTTTLQCYPSRLLEALPILGLPNHTGECPSWAGWPHKPQMEPDSRGKCSAALGLQLPLSLTSPSQLMETTCFQPFPTHRGGLCPAWSWSSCRARLSARAAFPAVASTCHQFGNPDRRSRTTFSHP